MIYLLGGPPRVGKSTICKTITDQHGINVVSTDSLSAVLEDVLSSEAEPGLFAVSRFDGLSGVTRTEMIVKSTSERIRRQIEESCAVWKAVVPFALREQEEGRDVVVEGVAVLPRLVNQLDGVDCRAVFVGNQSSQHKDNIKRSAKDNPHDWMRHAPDEYIDAFATFVVHMSSYIRKEAQRYGYPYLELAERPFGDAATEVANSLLVRSGAAE